MKAKRFRSEQGELCILRLWYSIMQFLHWSPVAYWAPTDLGSSSFSILSFLPFHTVHGVLKARILKRFAIPFSSGPHSVRPLHHDPPVLGCPMGMAWFHWVRQGCDPSVIRLTSFLSTVSVCLPADALLQHLPSYLGFPYLGRGVSLHSCSSKV